MTQTTIQTFHPLDPPTADEFRQAASICGATTAWTIVVDSRRWKSLNRASSSAPPSMEAAPPPIRHTIMICFDRGSKTRWRSGEFVNQSGQDGRRNGQPC